ncbi:hypothetical protein ASE96_13570 [Arthrobacter sp. Leaf69]|nr:hypothetical protein ASE96_13570 [Arthrobacter sp. Leaf69]
MFSPARTTAEWPGSVVLAGAMTSCSESTIARSDSATRTSPSSLASSSEISAEPNVPWPGPRRVME